MPQQTSPSAEGLGSGKVTRESLVLSKWKARGDWSAMLAVSGSSSSRRAQIRKEFTGVCGSLPPQSFPRHPKCFPHTGSLYF